MEGATYYRDPVTPEDPWSPGEWTPPDFVTVALSSGDGNTPIKQHSCLRREVDGLSYDGVSQCADFVDGLANATEDEIIRGVRCHDLVFDTSVVTSSFVTRFGLVCDHFYLRGIMNSMMMVGMLLGSLPVGVISDKYGRKVALLTCLIVQPLAGIVGAFSPWLTLLAVCRIFVGMAVIGKRSYLLLSSMTRY